MTEQPSSYRCETCENTDCKYNHLKGQIGRTRKWNGKELKGVTFTPTSFTEEMGCASHSAFSAPPERAAPEYKFGYFSRHKYQDLVFYVVNDDGQTNTGLFEMPDTPENRALMEALIPRPINAPPEGAVPEHEEVLSLMIIESLRQPEQKKEVTE